MIPAPMLERLRMSIPAVLAVAALAYLVIGYSAGRAVGEAGNPEVFIHAGQAWLAPDLLPEGAYHQTSTGYDGQFFFYLAQDPLLNGRAARRDQLQSDHIDNVAYRYQRILLPALGWLTSGGNPDLLVWTLPLLNLLAVLGATLVLARFLARHGRSPWVALGFALSLAVIVGVVRDLADPLAVSLFVIGVAWWLDERTWPAIAALGACVLARELYVIPATVIAAIELLRRGRAAGPWLVPLAVCALWQAYVRLALTGDPADASAPSIVPLRGAVQKAREVLREDVLGAAQWELACVGVLLAVWAAFAVAGARPAVAMLRDRRAATRRDLFPVVALAGLALLPFLTLDLWRDIPSYTRQAAAAGGMLVLAHALRPSWWSASLLTAIVALTITNPVVPLVPAHREGVVRPPTPLGPGQARVRAIQGCLRTAGLRSGQVPDEAPSGTSALSVTLSSGREARVLVFASPADAQRYAAAAERLAGAQGGASADSLQRQGDAVVVAPRAAAAAERAPLARCVAGG